jgi:pimeloyl-ACP methyl ester carboxylesterase
MSVQIERGYVRIGRRHVHYRRAGSGPAIVLLHASPVSSAMFLEQLEIFAENFTAIALDTPGYGLSDGLGLEAPGIAHYADALIPVLDALGLDKTLLYGRHTGASIAIEAARRHPDRVIRVLCDGYPVFPPEARQRYLDEYLIPLKTSWDGSHLAFWWLRYRDQHVFWPWDIQTTAKRSDADVPSLDFLNRGFTAIMMAGDAYRTAYAAAFLHDSIDALSELREQCWLTVRPGDSLFAGFDKVPDGHEKRILPRDTIEAAYVEREMFETVRAGAAVPIFPASDYGTLQDGDRIFLPIPGGSLHAKLVGVAENCNPIVLLAPQPGGLASISEELASIGAHWPVLGIEAPGQSDSDTPVPGSLDIAADWIAAALAGLGITPHLVAGIRGSCGIAVEMSLRSGTGLVLLDPPLLTPALRETFATTYPVDITPRDDGGHVLTTWMLLRDERLWSPWYDRRHATALPIVAGIEADSLHARAVDLLKQPTHIHALMRAVWQHPLTERVALLTAPCWIIRAATDMFAGISEPTTLPVIETGPDGVGPIIAKLSRT